MQEYKAEKHTVEEIISILSNIECQDAIVYNGKEKPVKIYVGKENKKSGKPIVMICQLINN